MKIGALKTELSEIQRLRALFLQETNFQIRYNACHERNWSDSYLLFADELEIGYGSVKGKDNLTDRNSIFEFFIAPPFRKISGQVFQELLRTSNANFIECQSNDVNLTSLLYEFGRNINADAILFNNSVVTEMKMPNVSFRSRREGEPVFEHSVEPVGNYVLEKEGEVIATGGFMLHYNIPFADLYMEVKENYRGIGCGGFMVQELKRACYLSGRVPAARCNILNIPSKSALIKGGLKICGYLLTGDVKSF